MWRWRMGDPSLVPTCHGAMASARPRLTKNSWFYLSLPRRPSACSLEGPLWRCPHCSLFKGLLKTRLCPVLPRQWGSGCQQAVGGLGPTLQADLGRGLPLGQAWGGSLA